MFLVDFIVMNFDRHMRNFGVIRNVETLKWERLTPIFDTGECLQCDKIINEMNFKDDKCKFFKNTNMNLSRLLDYIDITRYDLTVLNEIPDKFKEKLNKYKKYTDMSDERIGRLYRGLQNRIKELQNYKKNK